ncbi:hypothetical protein D3C80_1127790 [compost metagenome]
MPNCHTTAAREQNTTKRVLRTQRVYRKMITREVTTARAKNIITWIRPSIRSPISLAKPMTRTLYLPSPSLPDARALLSPPYSYVSRNCCSSICENCR